MKRTIMLLLTLLLALLTPLCAGADMQAGDYTYLVQEDGTAQITGYTGESMDLVIPAELDGHAVTAISDAAFQGMCLRSLVLPDCVTSVGFGAFMAGNDSRTITPYSTLE